MGLIEVDISELLDAVEASSFNLYDVIEKLITHTNAQNYWILHVDANGEITIIPDRKAVLKALGVKSLRSVEVDEVIRGFAQKLGENERLVLVHAYDDSYYVYLKFK